MEVKKSHEEPLPVWAWLSILILAGFIAGSMLWTGMDSYENDGVALTTIVNNSPKPTKISIKDWKTYENKDLGFSFKYPSDWEIREDGANKEMTILDSTHKTIQQAGGELGLSISFDNVAYSSFDDMVGKYEKNDDTKAIDKALNDTISAKFLKTIEGRSVYLFQSPDKKHFLSLFDNPDNSVNISDFNQILSTFQFTDSEATTSQVYTNSTYGFSLTFPKGWEDYKMKEAKIDGSIATYYVNIPTKFPASPEGDSIDLKGHYSPFAISVYTLDQWNEALLGEGLQFSLIAKNDKYAVTWAHAQWAPEDFKSDGDIAGIIASFKFTN